MHRNTPNIHCGLVMCLIFKNPDSVRSNGQSSDILTLLKKIESFGPYFEAMQQDTKKLAGQVEECRGLSDRLSGMVNQYVL